MKLTLARLLFMAVFLLGAASVLAANFTDNGNGTIADANTGLVWQKTDDGTTRSWVAALTYCEGLTLAGQTDWRLPNIRELRSIVDSTRYDPSINPVFTSTVSSKAWSSTTFIGTSRAWDVSFYDGSVDNDDKAGSFYVRCVRGGQ